MNPTKLFGEPTINDSIKPHYKLIILIIASPGEHYDIFKEVWEGYMNRFSDVKSFFLYSDENLGSQIVVKDNSITHKFKEWYEPGILYKTIAGMKHCTENYTYEFMLRTNLSSFFIIPRLLNFLELAKKTGYALAIQNVFREDVKFLSGAGFILSKDIIENLLNIVYEKPSIFTEELLSYPDDVAISQIVGKMEFVTFSDMSRYDCNDLLVLTDIDNSIFHIRNKTEWKYGNRDIDKKNMELLYDFFYGI